MKGKIEYLIKNSNEYGKSLMFEQNSWINFTVLDIGVGYKVKRIEVLPHKQLSFQNNKFCPEHWTIVQGTAKVTINDRIFSVKTGETVDFGVGEICRVENPDNSDILVFINVQCGLNVLGEDFNPLPEETGKSADAAR